MLPLHELALQSELSKVDIKGKKGSFEKVFPRKLVRTGHNHFQVSVSQMGLYILRLADDAEQMH